MSSCCSVVNTPTGHSGSAHFQVRLAPHDPYRPAEARSIDQPDRAAAMAASDYPAGTAALLGPGRLHRHLQPMISVDNVDHANAGEPDQQIAIGRSR